MCKSQVLACLRVRYAASGKAWDAGDGVVPSADDVGATFVVIVGDGTITGFFDASPEE